MKYLLFLIAFVSSCSSTHIKTLPLPEHFQAPQYTQLTFKGENAESTFSPDGLKIIYQGSKKEQHKNSQIYILDLITKAEKRITHNDGDDSCASFSADGKKIIYASTTDEIKERAEELLANPENLLPYEIYTADIDGSHIRRITRSPGYDAEGRFSPLGGKIIFTTNRNKIFELMTIHLDGTNNQKIFPNVLPQSSPVYSPQGKKITWVADGQIFIAHTNGTGQKKLTLGEGHSYSPTWHPDGKKILFSSNKENKDNFELYTIDTDSLCIKRLTYTPSSELFGQFSKDGKKITFTSNATGINQVFIMDYTEPQNCLTN